MTFALGDQANRPMAHPASAARSKGIASADVDVARLALFLNAQRNIAIYFEENSSNGSI